MISAFINTWPKGIIEVVFRRILLMRFCCYSGIYCSRGSVFFGSFVCNFLPLLFPHSLRCSRCRRLPVFLARLPGFEIKKNLRAAAKMPTLFTTVPRLPPPQSGWKWVPLIMFFKIDLPKTNNRWRCFWSCLYSEVNI